MTAVVYPLQRPLPLVAVVSHVPLLAEAIEAALQGIAEVRCFPSRPEETAGLLDSLNPDAAVVDDGDAAAAVAAASPRAYSPLVHISLKPPRIRVLTNGVWEESNDPSLSPETLRNVIVGGLFGRGRRA